MTTPTPPPTPTHPNRGGIARAVLSAAFVALCVLVLASYALAQWLGTWAWWLIPGIAVTALGWWIRRRWRRRRDGKNPARAAARQARAAATAARKSVKASGGSRKAQRSAARAARTAAAKRAAASPRTAPGRAPGAGRTSRARPSGSQRAASAASGSRRTGTGRTASGSRTTGHRAGRSGARSSGFAGPSGRGGGPGRTVRTRLARSMAISKKNRKRIRKQLRAMANRSREHMAAAWEARELGRAMLGLFELIDPRIIRLGGRAALGAIGGATYYTWSSFIRARNAATRWARAQAEATFGPWRRLLYTLVADGTSRWEFYPPPWGFDVYAPEPPGSRRGTVLEGVIVGNTLHDPATAPPLSGPITIRAALAPVHLGDTAMQPEFEAAKVALDEIHFSDTMPLLTFDAKLRSAPPLLATMAQMINRLAMASLNDMPPNKPEFIAIGDTLNTIGNALVGLSAELSEISPALRTAFSEEIEAIESGHHNADALDVARNRDAE